MGGFDDLEQPPGAVAGSVKTGHVRRHVFIDADVIAFDDRADPARQVGAAGGSPGEKKTVDGEFTAVGQLYMAYARIPRDGLKRRGVDIVTPLNLLIRQPVREENDFPDDQRQNVRFVLGELASA